MRIRVGYETAYEYEQPITGAVQLIRMTPRGHDGQRVSRWRVQVDADGRLRETHDGLGNVVHTFYLSRPAPRLRILVEGEAEVTDTCGVVAGAPEPFAPQAFLRETPLTEPAPGLAELARRAASASQDDLGRLHRLMTIIHEEMAFQPGATASATPAADALALGRGVCQDMTHVFLAAARLMGAPARYVSGHLVRTDCVDQEAGHAWAEAFVPGLGWVGFDTANGVCATERHLRVAVGLDYLGAAPVRGSRRGGGGETMEVRLRVSDAGQRQTHGRQSQSQGRSQGQSQSQSQG